MAQMNTVNPYPQIGKQLTQGLGAIIAQLPASPTIDDLADAIYAYVQPLYYLPSTKLEIEVKSVVYNVANSYRNNQVLNGNAVFDSEQAPFIEMLIGSEMTVNFAPDSLLDRLVDIEDNVGTSDLTVMAQTPLFLATISGSSAALYWGTELSNPQSQWIAYFSTNAGQNYSNSLLWSLAAMNGALAGYGAVSNSMIEPTTSVVTNKMVSALIGALTATVGKVIFNWIPRIVKPLSLSRDRIGKLTNAGNGNNGTAMFSGGCTDGCNCYSYWRCTKSNCTDDCSFTRSAGICPLNVLNNNQNM
jgi:hypothetical protein